MKFYSYILFFLSFIFPSQPKPKGKQKLLPPFSLSIKKNLTHEIHKFISSSQKEYKYFQHQVKVFSLMIFFFVNVLRSNRSIELEPPVSWGSI